MTQDGSPKILMVEDDMIIAADISMQLTGRTYQLNVPLGTLESRLPAEQFIRTHRSFLVNLYQVDTLEEHGKYLTIQEYRIPISRRQRKLILSSIKCL
jgi:DNA-binding LytR/AlgR family response regulator